MRRSSNSSDQVFGHGRLRTKKIWSAIAYIAGQLDEVRDLKARLYAHGS